MSRRRGPFIHRKGTQDPIRADHINFCSDLCRVFGIQHPLCGGDNAEINGIHRLAGEDLHHAAVHAQKQRDHPSAEPPPMAES